MGWYHNICTKISMFHILEFSEIALLFHHFLIFCFKDTLNYMPLQCCQL